MFQLGRLVATPGALQAMAEAGVNPASLLLRHQSGDWGDVDNTDWKLNDAALKEGSRLLSAYVLPSGVRLWVITEHDHSVTTVLLPREY